MVHVLGADARRQRFDGLRHRAARAGAVFADARLPFEPVAWALDVAKPYPTDDRQQTPRLRRRRHRRDRRGRPARVRLAAARRHRRAR